jgi:hypothetical protein
MGRAIIDILQPRGYQFNELTVAMFLPTEQAYVQVFLSIEVEGSTRSELGCVT